MNLSRLTPPSVQALSEDWLVGEDLIPRGRKPYRFPRLTGYLLADGSPEDFPVALFVAGRMRCSLQVWQRLVSVLALNTRSASGNTMRSSLSKCLRDETTADSSKCLACLRR